MPAVDCRARYTAPVVPRAATSSWPPETSALGPEVNTPPRLTKPLHPRPLTQLFTQVLLPDPRTAMSRRPGSRDAADGCEVHSPPRFSNGAQRSANQVCRRVPSVARTKTSMWPGWRATAAGDEVRTPPTNVHALQPTP